MEVVQPLTEARGVICPARAIVLRLAVALIGWTYTLTRVEGTRHLLQLQVRLQRLVVIPCLDGLFWAAIRIMYPDVHCQRRKLFLEVTRTKDVRVLVSQLAMSLPVLNMRASAVSLHG